MLQLSAHGEVTSAPPKIGVRHLQCFLLFWSEFFAYAMRVNFSLAIVAMTDKTMANPDFEEYNWSEKTKSVLLSGFFWGCLITQIPGGYVARRLGGKLALGAGLFVCSISTMLSPLSVRLGGWRLLLAMRVLQGLSQGTVFPSVHTVLAEWTPKDERAVLGTFAYSGSELGVIVIFITGGYIASSAYGWPGIFYVSGGACLIWSVAWYLWGASSPRDCKFISQIEKSYIEMSILDDGDKNEEHPPSVDAKRHYKIPWLNFFTSPPFWAILVAHSAFNWTFWTIFTQIPSYMKNVLDFDIERNALFSSLPSLAMLLLDFLFSALAALISQRRWLSLTASRKFFNTLSMWGPALALACLGYVDSNHKTLAVILLVTAIGFQAAIHMGFLINHIDISPNYAGILVAITNMIANLMSVLAPLVVGFVVNDETNPVQWRYVFMIAAGFCFFSNLIYIGFGSAEVQPWNQPERILVKTNNQNRIESEIL